MKPKTPLKGGDEQDLLSPWRKVLKCADRPGVVKAAQRSYNKRLRRELRVDPHETIEDEIDPEEWHYLIHRNDD
jgi:hypothetical protein